MQLRYRLGHEKAKNAQPIELSLQVGTVCCTIAQAAKRVKRRLRQEWLSELATTRDLVHERLALRRELAARLLLLVHLAPAALELVDGGLLVRVLRIRSRVGLRRPIPMLPSHFGARCSKMPCSRIRIAPS